MDVLQREKVCESYGYSCGYCGVHESDAGATLTVDHYHPTTHGGSDDDENLVYCCSRCDEHKSAYWHKVHPPYIRLLHPFKDNLTSHIHALQNGQLVGQTMEGRFYIQRLRLNRQQLIEHRLGKQVDQERQNEIKKLRQEISDLQRQLIRLNSSLQETLTEIDRETTSIG